MREMPHIGEIRQGREIGKKPFNSKFIWHACVKCGKERWVGLMGENNPRSKLCLKCGAISSAPERSYDKSPSWKGGHHKDTDGYILTRLQRNDFFYPMARKDRCVLEHRLVMATHLNRCLLSWEVVHHKNGVKEDNRLENLQLLPTGLQHMPSKLWQAELSKRDKRLAQLETRLTLLEAENVLLKTGLSQNIIPQREM